MKIEKSKSVNYQRVLKLHLIQSRIYELKPTNTQNFDDGSDFSSIIKNIKKSLKIIFQYNQSNKRILFVGINNNELVKKINNNTNHVAMISGFSKQGVLSNNFSNITKEYLSSKYKTKPDLIVIFDTFKEIDEIVKESYLLKIPSIIFGVEPKNVKKSKSFFSTNGNFNFLKNQIFFYKYLNFLFKKQYKLNKNETKEKI